MASASSIKPYSIPINSYGQTFYGPFSKKTVGDYDIDASQLDELSRSKLLSLKLMQELNYTKWDATPGNLAAQQITTLAMKKIVQHYEYKYGIRICIVPLNKLRETITDLAGTMPPPSDSKRASAVGIITTMPNKDDWHVSPFLLEKNGNEKPTLVHLDPNQINGAAYASELVPNAIPENLVHQVHFGEELVADNHCCRAFALTALRTSLLDLKRQTDTSRYDRDVDTYKDVHTYVAGFNYQRGEYKTYVNASGDREARFAKMPPSWVVGSQVTSQAFSGKKPTGAKDGIATGWSKNSNLCSARDFFSNNPDKIAHPKTLGELRKRQKGEIKTEYRYSFPLSEPALQLIKASVPEMLKADGPSELALSGNFKWIRNDESLDFIWTRTQQGVDTYLRSKIFNWLSQLEGNQEDLCTTSHSSLIFTNCIIL